jgi:hypothetical protein
MKCDVLLGCTLPALAWVACIPEPKHGSGTDQDCLEHRVCVLGTCQASGEDAGADGQTGAPPGDAPLAREVDGDGPADPRAEGRPLDGARAGADAALGPSDVAPDRLAAADAPSQPSANITWTLDSLGNPTCDPASEQPLIAAALALYQQAYQNIAGVGPESAYRQVLVGTKPAAPKGLTATLATATRVDLAWIAGSGNEDGFSIERLDDGAWSLRANLDGGARSWSDTVMAGGAPYQYRIFAFNGVGASGYSNTAVADRQP